MFSLTYQVSLYMPLSVTRSGLALSMSSQAIVTCCNSATSFKCVQIAHVLFAVDTNKDCYETEIRFRWRQIGYITIIRKWEKTKMECSKDDEQWKDCADYHTKNTKREVYSKLCYKLTAYFTARNRDKKITTVISFSFLPARRYASVVPVSRMLWPYVYLSGRLSQAEVNWKGIRYLKIRVLSSAILFQTLDYENFHNGTSTVASVVNSC